MPVAPGHAGERPALARWYWRLAVVTALLALAFLPVHLVAGGLLSTYIIEWHLDRSQVSVLPYVIIYGGGAAAGLVPATFAVASWRLQLAPSARAWQVLPWLSVLAWPLLMLASSLVFDVVRWTAAP